MSGRASFLHITDAHLSASGVPYPRDDVKFRIPDVAEGTREAAFRLLMSRVAEQVRTESLALEAVLFSGDAQHMGKPGGHELLLELLREHLFPLGLTNDRIVSVPGNHDVRRDTPPSSGERYEDFLNVWSTEGCIVPWLDGVDPRQGFDHDKHRLVASDRSWAVYPVNTSNWSNVTVQPPEPLGGLWSDIPTALAPGDDALANELRSQLQSLLRHDMCRVSPDQLEVLRAIVASTPRPDHGKQLRIVVMHHHMRSPSLGEELKPFSDMSNLEQFRAFLRGSGIDVVLHGHKHVQAAYFDHIPADGDLQFQRTLVVSGSTFELRSELDAVRLVTLEGLPHIPQVKIEPIALPRSGAEQPRPRPVVQRLWTTAAQAAQGVVISDNAPIVVEGSDLDEVYARAVDLAKSDAKGGILIVHLDLPEDDTSLPLPRAYAVPSDVHEDERQSWLRELVEWWQLGRSQLEPRIPYLHGARLQRYGGKIDQIARIIALLRQKPSTRALAVLVDPFRDFTLTGENEEFASFCLVEFRRREVEPGRIIVDAIAFYRAQEFERWWPVNIAELRLLQSRICGELGFKPGRITTIAADARTISRSPTQVAMPIVDRWLDQAPERLHLLADALVRGTVSSEAQSSAVREWRRSMSELRQATNAYNADGIPVAIDGLRTLAAYISATAPTGDGELTELAQNIGHLANANTTFGQPNRTRADFDIWAPAAKAFLSSVERISESRLPSVSDDRRDGRIAIDQQ